MNEKDIKRAYESAHNELEAEKKKEQEKQIEEVKEIVKRTLTELESLKEKKQDIEEKIKILKLDLDDLKLGKLDRIKERQDKDPLAKKVSVIIIKETVIREREVSPWYTPWQIHWNTEAYPKYDKFFISCNSTGSVPLNNNYCYTTFTLNNSIVKDNVVGSYQLEDKTINLR